MDRTALAVTTAPGADVTGLLSTDSGALVNTPFSQRARFALEATPSGTNPEELLAAACASCFTAELGARLAAAGHAAHSLRTEARVQLIHPGGRWTIGAIRLHCSAIVPGIDDAEFRAIAHAAKAAGPIAHALLPDITLTVSRHDRVVVAEPASDPGLRLRP